MLKKGISMFLVLCFMLLMSSAALAAPSDTGLSHRSSKARGQIGTDGGLGSGGPGGILE